MSPEWIEIYKSYTSDELDVAISTLKKQLEDASGITAQGAGSKNYSRDLIHLQNRLHAAVRVRNLKTTSNQGGRQAGSWGVMDFSKLRV